LAAKTITCITCPVGCRVEVELGEDRAVIAVRGNECLRGRDYALDEALDPRRLLTTTIPIRRGVLAVLPVRTTAPIPKERLREAMRFIAGLTAEAPIRKGQVIVADLLGTGADLVAGRAMQQPTKAPLSPD